MDWWLFLVLLISALLFPFWAAWVAYAVCYGVSRGGYDGSLENVQRNIRFYENNKKAVDEMAKVSDPN